MHFLSGECDLRRRTANTKTVLAFDKERDCRGPERDEADILEPNGAQEETDDAVPERLRRTLRRILTQSLQGFKTQVSASRPPTAARSTLFAGQAPGKAPAYLLEVFIFGFTRIPWKQILCQCVCDGVHRQAQMTRCQNRFWAAGMQGRQATGLGTEAALRKPAGVEGRQASFVGDFHPAIALVCSSQVLGCRDL